MTPSEPNIYIVGIGSDGLAGLTAHARALVTTADLVLCSDATLGLVPELTVPRERIGTDLQETVRLLETNRHRRRLVILASGDPLFYGVAQYLCDRLGKDRFEVLPHVSSMQLAFARIRRAGKKPT